MDSATQPTGVFFGLRTAVELFRDPSSAHAVTRAKEAALLYDRVIFEVGMLDVTVGEGGGSSIWIPPSKITDERRALARIPTEEGAPFSVSFGKQEAFGVPARAEDMVPMVATTVTHAYVAEFHTGILDETEPLELDWIEVAETPVSFPAESEIGKQIKRADLHDWTDRQLLPDHHHFERDLIYKSFNRDAAVAGAIGATMTVSPLFEPMIRQRGMTFDRPGDKALSILIPNVGSLSWEAIAEFREHPGCVEAREMLRLFELKAAELEPEGDTVDLQILASEVADAYAGALEDSRTRLGAELSKEAIKTSVSLVPGIGPIAEKVATTVQVAREWGRQRRSWTSAICKLKDSL